jgi:GTP-binding protein
MLAIMVVTGLHGNGLPWGTTVLLPRSAVNSLGSREQFGKLGRHQGRRGGPIRKLARLSVGCGDWSDWLLVVDFGSISSTRLPIGTRNSYTTVLDRNSSTIAGRGSQGLSFQGTGPRNGNHSRECGAGFVPRHQAPGSPPEVMPTSSHTLPNCPASMLAESVENVMRRDDIRNIAIIAHVDHGKTTLVDALLKASGQFRETQLQGECILDSNDLERERGITILAKNIALTYQGIKINIIDTPGHADFGGEVERVLSMADGALVLVDAFEGPRPQTRFVLQKALQVGLQPVVVVNKIDRPDARPEAALSETFDLFVELGADDRTLDFPFIFASGRAGYATDDPRRPTNTIRPLLDMIVQHVPGPRVNPDGPLQFMITSLTYSEYVGRVATGRLVSGRIRPNQKVVLLKADGSKVPSTVVNVEEFDKLGRSPVAEASAGDIVALTGLENPEIGDTVADPEHPVPLPRISVDEPTIAMTFTINTSPLAGQPGGGKYLTSRHLRARLMRELESNVALRVEELGDKDAFKVSGRGVLHLSILIETMRREGYELSVGKPQVIRKQIDGRWHEPFELLEIDVPTSDLGAVMELVGNRRGQLVEMSSNDAGQTHVEFSIPARGLIGLRTKLLNATKGEAVIHHRFDGYRPQEGDVPRRANGVLVSQERGKAVAYALFKLQERADMFVAPGDDVYEGMIVGENSRDNDLVVNPIREKKLTNIRAAGSDENILLKPPRKMSLEMALEYIEDDEYVEVTPQAIRLRKIRLTEQERKQHARSSAAG